jgi:hypothetical protein
MGEKRYEIDLGRAQDYLEKYKDRPEFQHYVVGVLAKLDSDDLLDAHDALIKDSMPFIIRNRGDEEDTIKDSLWIYKDNQNKEVYRLGFRRDKGDSYIYTGDVTDEKGFKKYVFSAFHKKEIDSLVKKIIVARSWILNDMNALTETVRDLRNRLTMQPEIFKRTYLHCVTQIEDISKPLRALLNSDSLFESALERALKYAETLT